MELLIEGDLVALLRDYGILNYRHHDATQG